MHRSHRLRKNEEFQKIFQQGSSSANKQFVIYFARREGQAVFRAGISVSKKIGNAVTRNRVKRLIREALAALEDEILADMDFIVIARQGIEQMSLETITQSLRHVLKRAKLLRQSVVHNSKRG
ncbi:ribonuclease P protein component [Brevibacillus fulvus]|uniref:Ribonuclease P protein component n=1 Tax=Brevibacillus fulvus TaxID=1125967 RepID=A0A938Y278_9BACL|nr:ribonuclease P protein component [Brevibacillus fulvus]MBM7591823.1 ribonuclease P protein component [Brevibacillus fulvus]